jgi:hypothetical protein
VVASQSAEPDFERMGHELCLSFMPRIEEWRARVDGGPRQARVRDGSVLSVLDDQTAPFQTSHIALMSLGAAADHLNTVRLLLIEARTLPLWGIYPLLRSALECHAAALYVLGPRTRDEQIRHRLKLAAANDQNQAQAEALSTSISGVGAPTGEIRRRLVDLAVERGMRKDEIDGKPVSMLSTVRYAGQQAELDHVELYWRFLSGLSHGQQWSGLAAHNRTELEAQSGSASYLTEPDVAHVLSTSRWSYVGTLLAEGMQLGEAAWQRWDRLSRR